MRSPEIPGGVGPGWQPILDELQAHLDAQSPGYEVLQVKEKLGRLRVYAAPAPGASPAQRDALDAAVSDAEARSAAVCEQCGQPGVMRRSPSGWIRTLCPECADARDA